MAGLRRGPPQGPNMSVSRDPTMTVTPQGMRRAASPDDEAVQRAALAARYGFSSSANYPQLRNQPLRLNTPEDLNAAYGFDDPANWNYSVR